MNIKYYEEALDIKEQLNEALRKENAELKTRLEKAVELPCKIGDTVFVVAKCEGIQMRRDDDWFTGTGDVECPFEKTCSFEDCLDTNMRIFETVCTGFMMENGCRDGYHTFTGDINAEFSDDCWGKTVFSSREQAEARIKDLKEKKDE